MLDPLTAYQITSMMEGVVQRGTAQVVKAVGKPIAGKTGTTNDEKDAWFVGFSPDLVVGVFIGYDKPRPLGNGRPAASSRRRSSATSCRWRLKDKPATPFRVPPGVELIPISAATGLRAGSGEGAGVILEAFKPGTAPPDSYSVIGYDTVSRRSRRPRPSGPSAPGPAGLY